MGQPQSIVNTQIVNANEYNVDQSTQNKIQSNCMSNTVQSNILQIVGSNVKNLRTDQSNIAKNLCKLQTMINESKTSGTQNDVLNKLAQEIESKGGLPGTGGTSRSVTQVYNRMKANVNQSTINNITKDCILNQDQRNVIQIFGSDVADANITQVNNRFVECLQGYEDVKQIDSNIANKAKAELDQSVRSSAVDPLASFASLAAGSLPIVISVVISVCCLLSIVLSMFGGGGGGGRGGGLDSAGLLKSFNASTSSMSSPSYQSTQ